MSRLSELQEKRNTLASKIRGLAKQGGHDGSEWTPELQDEWSTACSSYDETQAEMNSIRSGGRNERIEQIDQEENKIVNWPFPPGVHPHQSRRLDCGTGTGDTFQNAAGNQIRAFKAGDTIATREEQDISVGRCIQAIATGNMNGLSQGEFYALTTSTDSSGGYLVSPTLSRRIIDLARSASVVIRAGVQTLPMDSPEVHLAKVTSDPTPMWRPELGVVTASEIGFGQIVLRAKSIATIVPLSLEILEDAGNVLSLVEQVVASAMGLAIDQAVLSGSGAENQPLGILNNPDVQSDAVSAAVTDYSEITNAVRLILAANYPGEINGLSWIMHPTLEAIYDGFVTATELQPLMPTPWASQLRRLRTTSLAVSAAANNPTNSIIGDFSQVILGTRNSGMQLRVLDAGQVTTTGGATINAVSQLARFLVVHQRVDVAIQRPTWLVNLTSIHTS